MIFKVFLLLSLMMPWLVLAETPEERGLAIFQQADMRDSGFGDLEVDLTMILRTGRGDESTRELRIKQLEVPEDGDKLLVVFETPKAIRGSALLSFSHKVEQDDQWLFLPAMQRVKKIASKNKSGPFLSSEFAFEDLTVQEVEKYDYRYEASEALDGEPCFLVTRIPKDEYSGYTRQRVWLDQAEYRVQKIEYYDRKDSLLKTLTMGDYQLYEGEFWKAQRMLMLNHQTRKSTELIWQNFRFRTGLTDARDFTTNSLRRVR